MSLFVSYPKSGRTWLRFMLDSYLSKLHGINVENVFQVEQLMPAAGGVEWTHLSSAMIYKLPYFQMGQLDLEKIKGQATVLLLRNVYATMASAYYHVHDRLQLFIGSSSAFLRSPVYGVIKWVSFVNLFYELRAFLGPIQVIYYEAFKEDTSRQFERLLRILGYEVVPSFLQEVLTEASFDNMKELGLSPAYSNTPLAPGDPTNPATFKVRSGTNHGFRSLFSQEDLTYIGRVVDDLLYIKEKEWLKQSHLIPTS